MQREVNCLLVAETDPITGKMRRGPLMRAQNPPPGTRYIIRRDRFRYPKRTAYYSIDLVRVALNIIKVLSEQLVRQRETSEVDLAHSFFWNWERFDVPWIHENDQSLGQFLRDYLHIKGFVKRQSTRAFAAHLNHRNCRQVIVWSEWARRGYIEDGVEKSKVVVIPPPINPVRDQIHHDNCNILFVGRDYSRKGGDTVLRAFEKLNDFTNARLLYVGRIDDAKVLKRVTSNKRITYFPNPSDKLLYREIFPISDIFVLPTRADAFAISVVEAMSRALPVVVSNVCALPEIVEDRVSGFLSAPADAFSFSKYLGKLLEDSELRRKMGEAAQRKVTLNFSSEAIGTRLWQVYSNALAK